MYEGRYFDVVPGPPKWNSRTLSSFLTYSQLQEWGAFSFMSSECSTLQSDSNLDQSRVGQESSTFLHGPKSGPCPIEIDPGMILACLSTINRNAHCIVMPIMSTALFRRNRTGWANGADNPRVMA